jgi:hypothetical protein
VTAALACLTVGAAVAGCSDGGGSQERSAEQLLDDANDTMKALKSVTIDANTSTTSGGGYSSRQTTDLKGTCTFKVTWTKGQALEQIRIGTSDYVRPNRTYLEQTVGRAAADTKYRNRWFKTPTSEWRPGDGTTDCTWSFDSFGKPTRGEPTKVDGRPAIPLVTTDKADKEGAYTFYVAAEGKPYLLKVVYQGPKDRSTTTFSAFDEPLDVRPPAEADVLDPSDIGS